MDDLRNTKLLTNNKNNLSHILPAYLPVKKSNTLLVQGYSARQLVLDAGQAFQLQHLPAPLFQREGLRYIPIENLNYVFYMVTNPKFPLCPEALRFIELLKEEIKKAYP
jgi:hypothetical protein